MFRLTSFLAVLVVLVRSASGQVQDIEPPVLLDLWCDPPVINTSYSDQVVTVHLELSDNLTGLNRADVAFRGPSTAQRIDAFARSTTLVSGDALHGFYEDDITFPQYSEMGVWRPGSMWINDKIGNVWQEHWGSLTSYLEGKGIDATVTIVPEPSTLALLAMGAVGLLAYGWRRKRKAG